MVANPPLILVIYIGINQKIGIWKVNEIRSNYTTKMKGINIFSLIRMIFELRRRFFCADSPLFFRFIY